MVVDGGFWSKECLVNLHDLCDAFIAGMPTHLKESRNILASYGDGISSYVNEFVFVNPKTRHYYKIKFRHYYQRIDGIYCYLFNTLCYQIKKIKT